MSGMSDVFLTEVGNYSKGWYGNYTGDGRIAFDELKLIFAEICGMEPQYVSEKDIFLNVCTIFAQLSLKSDSRNPIYLWHDVMKETFYPNTLFKQPAFDSAEVRLLNRMLGEIHLMTRTCFPDPAMPMNPKIAMLFSNGEERLAKRAKMEASWAEMETAK
jgi:hypothetical protein